MEVADVPVAAVVLVDVEGAGGGADGVTAACVGSLFDIAMCAAIGTLEVASLYVVAGTLVMKEPSPSWA